jgi:hypothetical protein
MLPVPVFAGLESLDLAKRPCLDGGNPIAAKANKGAARLLRRARHGLDRRRCQVRRWVWAAESLSDGRERARRHRRRRSTAGQRQGCNRS